MAINLVFNGKYTNAFYKLAAAEVEKGGVSVEKRGRGYTDWDIVGRLMRAGYLEGKRLGPRGGTRYVITDAGREAMSEARQRMGWSY